MKRESRRQIAPLVYLKNNVSGDLMLYGGMEFLYWAVMAAFAFLSAYLAEKGFSSTSVGIIIALVNLAGILGSTIAGDISDKLNSPRMTFILCMVVSGVLYALVPLGIDVNTSLWNPGVILIVLWSLTSRPMQGLCESIVVSAADRKRTFPFGTARLFGSASYSLLCAVYGVLVKRLGGQTFTCYAYGILGIPLIALILYAKKDDPADRAPVQKKEKAKKNEFGLRAAMKNYYLLMFLFCHCLIILPLKCSTTFLPYKLLEELGSTEALGTISAIRAAMEIPMLLFGSRIVRRFGIKNLFYVDMSLFLASQVILRFAHSVPVITFGMALMGLAYGAHLLGQVNYIYRITPHEATSSAQSLAVSISLVTTVIVNLVGGVVIDAFSTNGMYVILIVIEVVAMLAFVGTFPLGKLLKKPAPDLSNIV